MFALRLLLLPVFLIFGACATTKQPALKPPGISREEKISLGGFEQTIFIRGRDRSNPVLLFLHGGPGLPQMPFSHVNADLERDFVVVHWDQRGAGKSFDPNLPLATMNTAQFLRDAEELTRHLRRTFHQPKIYLVGYSWGSFLGAQLVARRPELFRAYIGVSQVVDIPTSELLLHHAGIAEAEARDRPRIAARLRAIGEPPYRTGRDERLVNTLTAKVQPPIPDKMTPARYLWLGLQSPYYSLRDDVRLIRGFSFSARALEKDLWARDLRRDVPEIDVPVYFFLGRRDTVISTPLAADYIRALRAPFGKHLIWFEQSDHNLHLEESAKYRAELRRVLAETRDR